MQTPRVAILLPTYEPKPEHLRSAVESVLRQSEGHWTLSIQDDASGADVAAMITPFLSDPRITFARNASRRGIGGNWNACLERARMSGAPFVQFLFQDDHWEPAYLARCLSVFGRHPSVGLLAVEHAYRFEGEETSRSSYEDIATERHSLPAEPQDGQTFLRAWLLRGLYPNIIGEPSFVMLRKSLVEGTENFLEDMPQSLDTEYWVRALPQTQWCVLHESLGFFRVHAEGTSARNRRAGVGIFDRLRCIEGAMRRLPSPADRRAARKALVGILEEMCRKFLRRAKGKESLSTQGGSHLRTFAVRHPLLLTRAMLRALTRSASSAPPRP